MDQPLDLSQRENSAFSRYVERGTEEELICETPNCNCQRKHLTVLESSGRNIYGSNQAFTSTTNEMFHLNGYSYNSDSYFSGHKRSSMPEMPNLSLCHPKRRKMEIFKQKLARSVSENELSSPYQSSERTPIDKSDTQTSFSGSEASSYSPSSAQSDKQGKCIWKEKDMGKESNKDTSINHMERLPKKRAHARHLSFSYETSTSNNSSQSNSPVSEKNENVKQRSPIFLQPAGQFLHENNENIAIQPWNPLPKTTVIRSPINTLPKQSEVKPLSEKEKSFNALKADIIRELDNDKDDEDISAFRKRFYKYCTTGAKAISSVMSDKHPGGIRMSALGHLISTALLQREDSAYRTKNNHIHQIIKGEKPGKLCLMDMVELQVEIGLA